MKKTELVYRQLLYEALEQQNRSLTQAGLARALGLSLSTVHHALQPLRTMGAVRIRQRSCEIVNPKKLLYYWASIRHLERDIIYQTRVSRPVDEIEKAMPGTVLFAAYSAYKFRFRSVPADYSEVYVYSSDLTELQKRFPPAAGPPNLMVLKKDVDRMTLGHLFVDLWNLKEWYAREFLQELEARLSLEE